MSRWYLGLNAAQKATVRRLRKAFNGDPAVGKGSDGWFVRPTPSIGEVEHLQLIYRSAQNVPTVWDLLPDGSSSQARRET